jgi:hypothetical protein
MYIVWGRRWPLVIVPCACIAVYMTFATVRYGPRISSPARNAALNPAQMLLQKSVDVSRALSDPSRFIEALHEVEMLRNDIIIAFSLSLVANSFCTGEFS